MTAAPAALSQALATLADRRFCPLDLIPQESLAEKLIELDQLGPPAAAGAIGTELAAIGRLLAATDTRQVRVVLFGGGTGLANLVGGDSRNPAWTASPFRGLKELFPHTTSVVCVTDDGGSTGEILKDLPLVALGDLRHVLLASIQEQQLMERYGLTGQQARALAALLFRLFNHRFQEPPLSAAALLEAAGVDPEAMPPAMWRGLAPLVRALFADPRLAPTLARPQCLGNLLLAAAAYAPNNGAGISDAHPGPEAVLKGLQTLACFLAANPFGVLPCTLTPAQIKVLYANGVLVTGEAKSGTALRGYPVDRVLVEFAGPPAVPAEVLAAVAEADIIAFAPGSLFTSIVPVLQVPGLAAAVRANTRALKILVANLWVQEGETDSAREHPERRFHVSDLLKAYQRNIPGGVHGLFQLVLTTGLQHIPGHVLQSYAVENKVPIYLDREAVRRLGFEPIAAMLFSPQALRERRVIQHDPATMARTFRVLWAIRDELPAGPAALAAALPEPPAVLHPDRQTPAARLAAIRQRLAALRLPPACLSRITAILWRHRDIRLMHLAYLDGIVPVAAGAWPRSQEWDNVFSFYEPETRLVKIREDVWERPDRFEVAFLVALGQSLLGNYAADKRMEAIAFEGEELGKVFFLTVRPAAERQCLFTDAELDDYLTLARLRPSVTVPRRYQRLVSGPEGFTPPGLLFGLLFAWYLDNRFEAHIDYKMTIVKNRVSDLIHEQGRILVRRQGLIDFFRERVFGDRRPLPA
ncbi:MAG: 2-phospho-L-lactate transferase CofD family protein [Thermodesulfobacteriota bacterium]